jgi:hypothetical protein
MKQSRRIGFSFLLALPIEAANLGLLGIMLDPGPAPTGIFNKFLQYEWVFFHFLGFRSIDWLHYNVLGTEKAALVAAFVLAYVQTALLLFLLWEAVRWFRSRTGALPQTVHPV